MTQLATFSIEEMIEINGNLEKKMVDLIEELRSFDPSHYTDELEQKDPYYYLKMVDEDPWTIKFSKWTTNALRDLMKYTLNQEFHLQYNNCGRHDTPETRYKKGEIEKILKERGQWRE